jgi:hypothetical protein
LLVEYWIPTGFFQFSLMVWQHVEWSGLSTELLNSLKNPESSNFFGFLILKI